MRHGRAAVGHGRHPGGPLESSFRGAMGAGGRGEHAGAVGFTGELVVGEFRGCRAVVSLRLLFSLADTRVPRVSRRAGGGSQAWAALCRGPSDPFGPAQYCLSDLISLYSLLFEI